MAVSLDDIASLSLEELRELKRQEDAQQLAALEARLPSPEEFERQAIIAALKRSYGAGKLRVETPSFQSPRPPGGTGLRT